MLLDYYENKGELTLLNRLNPIRLFVGNLNRELLQHVTFKQRHGSSTTVKPNLLNGHDNFDRV